MPTPHSETLLEILRHRASDTADRPAFIYLKDGETREIVVTWGEVDRRARAIAAKLQKKDLAGERVLLLYPPGIDFVIAFCACFYAGAVAVPAYPPDPRRLGRSLPRVRAIIEDCQARAVLTTSTLRTLARFLPMKGRLASLDWFASNKLQHGDTESWQEPDVNGSSVAFLQYTSGSTGSPKGVVITNSNLLVNQEMMRLISDSGDRSVILSWVPFYHDLGLIGGIVHPVYSGALSVIMSPLDFLQKPIRWLRAVTRYRATISAGPNFGFELCTRKISEEDRAGLDLQSWEMALVGAEPITASTLERFTEAFSPWGFQGTSFFQGYGLAEAVLSVSSGQLGVAHKTVVVDKEDLQKNILTLGNGDKAIEIVSCGRPLTDQEIIIVEPDGSAELGESAIGEIWVRGGNVGAGYWNREQETEETFQATIESTGEGPYLRTGDLGFRLDGELYVTGRLKDLIIIRGSNYYPQDIEASVEKAHPALRPGCGAAFSIESFGEERLVVVQEVRARALKRLDPTEILYAIRRTLLREEALRPFAVVLVKERTIPKTTSGKIRRHASREAFLDGSLKIVERDLQEEETQLVGLEELIAHPQEAREAVLLESLRSALPGSEEIDLDSPLVETSLDSLAIMELSHEVETRLGVELEIDLLLEGASARDLAKQILEDIASTQEDV